MNVSYFLDDIIILDLIFMFIFLSSIRRLGVNSSKPDKRQFNNGLSVFIVLDEINIPWFLYLNKCEKFRLKLLLIYLFFEFIILFFEQAILPIIYGKLFFF